MRRNPVSVSARMTMPGTESSYGALRMSSSVLSDGRAWKQWRAGIPIVDVATEETDLEEVFRSLTGG